MVHLTDLINCFSNIASQKDFIIVYRKTNGLEVDCYVLLFLKDVKRRFNLTHVTKVSAQTFTETYSAGKNLISLFNSNFFTSAENCRRE